MIVGRWSFRAFKAPRIRNEGSMFVRFCIEDSSRFHCLPLCLIFPLPPTLLEEVNKPGSGPSSWNPLSSPRPEHGIAEPQRKGQKKIGGKTGLTTAPKQQDLGTKKLHSCHERWRLPSTATGYQNTGMAMLAGKCAPWSKEPPLIYQCFNFVSFFGPKNVPSRTRRERKPHRDWSWRLLRLYAGFDSINGGIGCCECQSYVVRCRCSQQGTPSRMYVSSYDNVIRSQPTFFCIGAPQASARTSFCLSIVVLRRLFFCVLAPRFGPSLLHLPRPGVSASNMLYSSHVCPCWWTRSSQDR